MGYNFIYRCEYSDTYPSGVIYKQSLAVGQVLPEDGSVTLYISKGPQYTVMPDLYGATKPTPSASLPIADQLYHRLRYQPGNGWGSRARWWVPASRRAALSGPGPPPRWIPSR